MEYYSSAFILTLKRKMKTWLVFSVLALVLSISFLIVSCFFINQNNKVLFIALVSIILAISATFFTYVILNKVVVYSHHIKHIQSILLINKITGIYLIKDIGKIKTVSRYINVIPLTVIKDEEEMVIYFNICSSNNNFEISQKYELSISGRYITEYRGINE